jgi:hypothetical protein
MHIKDLDRAAPDGKAVELGRGVIDLVPCCARSRRSSSRATSPSSTKRSLDPLPGIAESIGYVRGAVAALA